MHKRTSGALEGGSGQSKQCSAAGGPGHAIGHRARSAMETELHGTASLTRLLQA